MIPMQLTILGSSSASPTSKRYPTAQVLEYRGRFFLIDCGEGTQMQLRKYRVKFSRIDHIFISHLHGDHYFGLIGLLSTFALTDRKKDLHIYAHSELPNLLKPQLDQLELEKMYRIVWHPISFKSQQVLYDDASFEIKSFPVVHRVSCCGFRFQEKPSQFLNLKKGMVEFYEIPIHLIQGIKKGDDFETPEGKIIPNARLTEKPKALRSYSFCTDTKPDPKYFDAIKDSTLLYHEATFDAKRVDMAKQTFHTTTHQAAEVAKKVGAKKLIIGHYSARHHDERILLNEVKTIFENSDAAIEGKVFDI